MTNVPNNKNGLKEHLLIWELNKPVLGTKSSAYIETKNPLAYYLF
jgi:hypothetical protein